ncbi:hypothetical protein CTI12_AA427880 [Artemisia annua]|uniref:Uncharacterized protein n=1 Tax=Artemisia annua TaxID=35608 RepID=A0A2U1M228_ARTAN|nr:hypothetical protein CTI12_AA427880 [Artemisia annua]
MRLGEENIHMPPPVVNGTTDVIIDNNVSAGGHVEPVSCASPATDANVIEPGLQSGNVLNESQVEKETLRAIWKTKGTLAYQYPVSKLKPQARCSGFKSCHGQLCEIDIFV